MTNPANRPSRRTMIRSLVGSSLLMPGIVSELLAGGDAPKAAPRDGALGGAGPLAPRPPHHPARAKRVIFIYATGGVSHIDTFDPKPTANGRDGSGKDKIMGSGWRSSANRHCGTTVTDLFPHVREIMHEACLIRSLKSAHFDHSEATLGFHTGSATFARPSM